MAATLPAYMALKQELETVEAEHRARVVKLAAEVERARKEGLAEALTLVRQTIIGWGLTPQQVFPAASAAVVASLSPAVAAAAGLPAPKRPPRVRKPTHAPRKPRPSAHKGPMKYAWEGQQWHGGRGPAPQWFKAALAQGVTLEQMLIRHPAGNGNGAAHDAAPNAPPTETRHPAP